MGYIMLLVHPPASGCNLITRDPGLWGDFKWFSHEIYLQLLRY